MCVVPSPRSPVGDLSLSLKGRGMIVLSLRDGAAQPRAPTMVLFSRAAALRAGADAGDHFV